MNERGHVARVTATIGASPQRVWDALVDPAQVEKYMDGARVTSDWQPGSTIVWEGEWKGTTFRDNGSVLESDPGRLLRYTHFSPLSGVPDVPANYHTVSIELREDGESTRLELRQDNNETEESKQHSEANWTTMIDGLKELVESS